MSDISSSPGWTRIYLPRIPWWHSPAFWIFQPIMLLGFQENFRHPVSFTLLVIGVQMIWFIPLLYVIFGPAIHMDVRADRFRISTRPTRFHQWRVVEAPWTAISAVRYYAEVRGSRQRYLKTFCVVVVTDKLGSRPFAFPMHKHTAFRTFMAALGQFTPHLPYLWMPIYRKYDRLWIDELPLPRDGYFRRVLRETTPPRTRSRGRLVSPASRQHTSGRHLPP